MAKLRQAIDEKFKQAKSIGAQTIFDTKMEARRNFHIGTPPWENTSEIVIVWN
jgi:hypothetical protein